MRDSVVKNSGSTPLIPPDRAVLMVAISPAVFTKANSAFNDSKSIVPLPFSFSSDCRGGVESTEGWGVGLIWLCGLGMKM